MARETDFLALYKLLDLKPDCAPAELKHAYRRRVAALHPDRESHRAAVPHAAEQLQYLTALYGAAMDFHRRHHRLPGALGAVARPQERRFPEQRAEATRANQQRGRWWPVALVLAAVAGAVWIMQPSPEYATIAYPAAPPLVDTEVPAPLGPSVLALDMDPRTVQMLQGTPILISGDRWEYGPSWILFDRDKVFDWYSSPLRPLRTGSTHPAARAPHAPHPTDGSGGRREQP